MLSIRQISYRNPTERTIEYFRSAPVEKVSAPTRLQFFLLLLVLAVSIALSLSNYNSFQLGSYMDDASYTVLAKSIVYSDSYGLMNVPGQPDPTRYPFGFPLILSAFVWLFPSTLDSLKVVSLLATILNIVLIFWGWPYLSLNSSRWWGLIIVFLYSVSTLVIGQTKMVMSEPYFTTLVLIGLIFTELFLTRRTLHPVAFIFTGMVLVLALFTRNIGIVLIAAVVFRILLLPIERSIKLKKFTYLLAGGILLLVIVTAFTPVTIKSLLPIEYLNQFTNPHKWGLDRIEVPIIPRIRGAFREYIITYLRFAVIPVGGGNSEMALGRKLGISNLPLLTGTLVGILILLGILSALRLRDLSPTVLIFEGLYLAAILFWPWRATRFLYPVLPFLFYNFLSGLKLILDQFNRIKIISKVKGPAVGMAIVIFALSSLSIYKGLKDHHSSIDYVRDLRMGTVWLNENAEKDALILAQQPQSVYLYSERNTIDFPAWEKGQSVEDFEKLFRNQGVDYIVIAPELIWRDDGLLEYDKFTSEIIMPMLNQLIQRNSIKVVYTSEPDKVIVYKVIYP